MAEFSQAFSVDFNIGASEFSSAFSNAFASASLSITSAASQIDGTGILSADGMLARDFSAAFGSAFH